MKDRDVEHVTVLDDLSSGYLENLPENLRMTFVRGSITDDELLKKIFKAGKFHTVVHFAANFANQSSVEHPQKDLEVNGQGTIRLFEHAVKYKVKRVVYSSSSCVYGHKEGLLREDDREFTTETPYAATKLLGEHYAHFFHSFHGLDIVTLRFFNVYGPGERPGRYRNVIPNFFNLALQRKPLPITGDGSETRDFSFVSDAVAGSMSAIRTKGVGGMVFNIGSGRETQILNIANEINKLTNNPAGVVMMPRRKWDGILRRLASIEKAKKHLNYHPHTFLEEGLKKTHEWFLSQDLVKVS
jgi:nucleoside-diphosphate-sugar epimerase